MPELSLTLSQVRDYIESSWGICVPMSTLYHAIESSNAPTYLRFGRRIYMKPNDVDAWIESQNAGVLK